jgi:hypothetical protein
MKLDAVIAVTQDKSQLEQGMYKLKVAKTRLKNNKGTEIMIGVDIGKQQIYDVGGKPQRQVNVTETASVQSPAPTPAPAQPVNRDVADNAYIATAEVDLDKLNGLL